MPDWKCNCKDLPLVGWEGHHAADGTIKWRNIGRQLEVRQGYCVECQCLLNTDGTVTPIVAVALLQEYATDQMEAADDAMAAAWSDLLEFIETL